MDENTLIPTAVVVAVAFFSLTIVALRASGRRGARRSRRPRKSATTSKGRWARPGATVEFGGRTLHGGLIYVGSKLPAVANRSTAEPALVDPKLAVGGRRGARRAPADLEYRPSYSRISRAARAAYLDWLEGGRSNPQVGIGYVLLFFHGLERRVLHDAPRDDEAREDLPLILAEVTRLIGIYGSNRSFREQASRFRDLLVAECEPLPRPDLLPRRTEEMTTQDAVDDGDALPLLLRSALGRIARDEGTLTAEWALAWAHCEPECGLRTPAIRCRAEFEALFRYRFEHRYGEDGLRVRACKRRIKAAYDPASPSFPRSVSVTVDLPDVATLVGPRRRIVTLGSDCCDALDSYSRWLARNPQGRGTFAAVALLPAELLDAGPPQQFEELRQRITSALGDNETAVFDTTDVCAPWLPEKGGRQSKRKAGEMARVIARAGFGIEPDVRFGGHGVARGEKIVVFRLGDDEPGAPSAAYSAASLLLHLAVLVSTSDRDLSDEEEERLYQHVFEGLLLEAPERLRLTAHHESLQLKPPRMRGVKRRLATLSDSQRDEVGHFLVRIAWADDRMDVAEVRMLEKIYGVLGLDPKSVHTEIHSIAGSPTASGGAPEAKTSGLDMAAIQSKMDETAAVSALLAGIFVEDDVTVPAASETAAAPSAGASATEAVVGSAVGPDDGEPRIHGLDLGHTRLVRHLGEQSEWTRDRYEELAESLGLMSDGALDTINDVAFEVCGAPLVEGDDPIEVYQDIFQELIA